jgi:hypothetical protein
VRKSIYGADGESDIAFGVETEGGKRHLVLLEDKIDEPQQERQAERYFERGQRHIENAEWDEFHVGLIAPRQYLTEELRDAYGNVVSFEEILECVDELDHDAIPMVSEVLRTALEKHEDGRSREKQTDQTVIAAVVDRLTEMQGDLPGVTIEDPSPRNLQIESDNPSHPSLHYHVYVSGPFNDNKADIRIDIDTRDEGEVKQVRTRLFEHIGDLDGFRQGSTEVNKVVYREVWREYSEWDEFIDRIAAATAELIRFYHPRLVEAEAETGEE